MAKVSLKYGLRTLYNSLVGRISPVEDAVEAIGTSSDTAAETGTLFAVLKWVKDKVVSIYNAITDGTNGLAAIKNSAASAATYAAAAKTAAQALSPFALGADAYNTGKVELAANITAKGVEASASETLPQLAQKVTAIAQQPIILSPSEVGDMYAKQLYGSLATPNYWNLYEVLNTLLNDGRLLNYGGILLAEYYREYDSIALSGAGTGGAYVVSDMENGVFKIYTEDITHTWSTEFDGKGNRWVAYCFANAGHDYEITDTNTSPRNIFIGKSVGTITLSSNCRCENIIVVDGNSLKNIICNKHSMSFGKRFVLHNITNLTVGSTGGSTPDGLFYSGGSLESVYLSGDTIGGCIFSQIASVTSCVIEANRFDYCYILGSNSIVYQLNTLFIKGNGNIRICRYGGAVQCSYLKSINIIAGSLNVDCGTQSTNVASNIRITLGYTTNNPSDIVTFTNYMNINHLWRNVTFLSLQDGWCKKLNISLLVSLDEANIYTYILQRLKQDEPDCGDGVTITLGSTNLAKLTSEESVQLLDDLTNIYGYTFA